MRTRHHQILDPTSQIYFGVCVRYFARAVLSRVKGYRQSEKNLGRSHKFRRAQFARNIGAVVVTCSQRVGGSTCTSITWASSPLVVLNSVSRQEPGRAP